MITGWTRQAIANMALSFYARPVVPPISEKEVQKLHANKLTSFCRGKKTGPDHVLT